MKSRLMLLFLFCHGLMACSRANPSGSAPTLTNGASSDPPADANISMLDVDRKAIFDALLVHVLTDPVLEHFREFYGTPQDRRFAIVSNGSYGIPWPAWYIPSVDNFESVRVLEGSTAEAGQPRLVGIRLDKFNLDDKPEADHLVLPDGQIEITILNAGGSGDGLQTIGGCSVYYDAKRSDGKWTVKFKGAFDP